MQANQRLEQAVARSADSERVSAELGLEAQQLRERLAAALAAAATGEGTTSAAAADGAAAAAALAENLKRELETASSQLEAQTYALRREQERCSELEELLATEQRKSEGLHAEARSLSSRADGAERAEMEALKTAATEVRGFGYRFVHPAIV